MIVLVIIFIKNSPRNPILALKILAIKNKYARGPFEFVLVT
jgi:hypothetical protein